MNRSVLKNVLPHLYILLFFFAVVAIYFLPLYQGKSIRQSDIMQYRGMAKEIMDYRSKHKEEPFWTSAMFSGMPSTMISMEYPGNLIKPIHQLTTYIAAYPSSLIFVSLVSFYILLLAFGVHKVLATIGALGFAFTSFNFIGIEVGHNAKIACMSYMPLVLAGLVLGYRKNIWLGASVLGIGTALQVVNNHIQITYYLLFILLAYVATELYQTISDRTWAIFIRKSLILLAAAVLGLLTHAAYFLTINEYGKFSIRGKTELTPLSANKENVRADGLDREYVFNYSNALDEPLTYLVPNYLGGASSGPLDKSSKTAEALRENGVDSQSAAQFIRNVPTYFGTQPYTAGPFYLGAVICFLFVLSMYALKGPLKWAMLTCVVFGILMTFGKNLPWFNYFLFDYFPLYNKFRSVTMAVVIPQFCVSLLAVLGLQAFFDVKDQSLKTKYLFSASATVGGLLVCIMITASFASYSAPADTLYQLPDWLITALEQDRKSLRISDTLRSMFFAAIAAALLWATVQWKLKESWSHFLLVALTLFDFWVINKRYLNNDNFDRKVIQNYYTPTEADAVLLEDSDPNFRVFNLQDPFNDARTSYFHKSVGGYSPAKLRRYQDLIERHLSQEHEKLIGRLKSGNFSMQDFPILNMLNAKYIMAGDKADGVLKNPFANGNAWFIQRLHAVNNPDEEITRLGEIDTKSEAVYDRSAFKVTSEAFKPDSSAQIKLIQFKPYDLTYTTSSVQNGFVVFSEVYYPKGWNVTIDDKPAQLVRVNYVLRGLEVPAGNHKIRMFMVNETYQIGNTLSFLASIMLIAGVAGAMYLYFKSPEPIKS